MMDEKLDHIGAKAKDLLSDFYRDVPFMSVTEDVVLGDQVILSPFVNLFGCDIGAYTKVGAFVEIGRGVRVGARCKIEARAFLPTGVIIEDEVFIGPGVIFTNDKYPQAVGDWSPQETIVRRGASIGAGAIILPGLVLGKGCMVGAGAIVTKHVPEGATVYG